MSPQLDEVCKKYGYKTVNVATWRDPSLSVLSGGRGPRSGYQVAASDISKPFIPKYKVRYPVPEPTDDEDSEDDMKEEDIPAKVDSPLEPPVDDTAAWEPDEAIEAHAEQASKSDAPEAASQIYETHDKETGAAENVDARDPEDFQPAADGAASPYIAEPLDMGGESPKPSKPDSAEPPSETVVGPVEEVPQDIGDFGADEEPQILLGEAEGSSDGDAPSQADDNHGEDKKVTFAPGTPEPKPTHRKKKSSNGSKSKKKRLVVPMSDLPPDVQVPIDGAFDDIPPSPSDPPTASEPDVIFDTDQQDSHDASAGHPSVVEAENGEGNKIEDSVTENSDSQQVFDAHEDVVVDEPSQEIVESFGSDVMTSDTIMALPEDSKTLDTDPSVLLPIENTPQEPQSVASVLPPPPPPPPEEAGLKKKRSKASSSKKKGSKSKLETLPPAISGLGIDFTEEPPALVPDCSPEPVNTAATDGKDEASADGRPSSDAAEQPEPASEAACGAGEPIASTTDPTNESNDTDVASEKSHVAEESTTPFDGDDVVSDAEPSVKKVAHYTIEGDKEKEQTAGDDVSSPADSGIAMEEAKAEDGSEADEGIDDSNPQITEDMSADAGSVVDGPLEDEAVVETVVPENAAADPDEEDATTDGDDTAENHTDVGDDTDKTGVGASGEECGSNTADPAHTEDVVNQSLGDAEASVAEILAALDESSPTSANSPADDADEATDAAPAADTKAEQDTSEKTDGDDDPSEPIASDGAQADDAAIEEKDNPSMADANTALGNEVTPADTSPIAEDTEEAPAIDDSLDQAAVSSPGGPASDDIDVIDAVESDEAHDAVEAPKAGELGDETEVMEEKAAESVVDGSAIVEPPVDAPDPNEHSPDMDPADPSAAEAGASPDTPAPGIQDEDLAPDEQPAAPPSPVLSKTGSHGSHKSSHWDRPHKANPLKEVFEAPVVLKRPHGHRTGSKDEIVHRGERKHRPHRSSEVDKERKEKRRLEKKMQEAARALEEERKKIEEDERRRTRRETKRVARKAAEEEVAKIAREEARRTAERDVERRRRRWHDRDLRGVDRREPKLQDKLRERKGKDRESARRDDERSTRESKTSSSTTSRPPLSKVFSGESVHRTGFFVTLGGEGGSERPSSRHSKGAPRSPKLDRSQTSPASVATAASETAAGGSRKSSHRSRRREGRDGEGEERASGRSSSHGRSGEHRRRRPTIGEREKPKSFFGSFFKRS